MSSHQASFNSSCHKLGDALLPVGAASIAVVFWGRFANIPIPSRCDFVASRTHSDLTDCMVERLMVAIKAASDFINLASEGDRQH